MGFLILTGGDQSTPLVSFADDIKHALADLTPLLREAAEQVIQPIFGRNYDRSGLRSGNGVLKQALTKTGSRGNFLRVTGNSITAGVDYSGLPYARFVIEGRGEVLPKSKKAIRFDINGKQVIVKHAKASPAHPLVYLGPEDFERLTSFLTSRLVQLGAKPISK